jgi:hypothetical protein
MIILPFQVIFARREEFNPSIFVTDGEKRFRTVLREFFPNVLHELCYYHISVNFRDAAISCLGVRFCKRRRVSKLLALFPILAHLPISEVLQGFVLILCEFRDLVIGGRLDVDCIRGLKDLAAYYWKYYMRLVSLIMCVFRVIRLFLSRSRSACPPKLWNIADRIALNLPTTSNGAEIQHAKMNSRIPRRHTSRHLVVELLQNLEDDHYQTNLRHEKNPNARIRGRPRDRTEEAFQEAMKMCVLSHHEHAVHTHEEILAFLKVGSPDIWFDGHGHWSLSSFLGDS